MNLEGVGMGRQEGHCTSSEKSAVHMWSEQEKQMQFIHINIQ